MIVGCRVATLGIAFRNLCHTGLDSKDVLHLFFSYGLLITYELEHVDDVLFIIVENLTIGFVVFYVVVALYAESSLSDVQ